MNGFLVNGVGVAVVRVTYPFLGMGIEFVDLSPNSRQQLEGMISSLTASKLRLPDAPAKPTLNLPPITQPAAALDAISQHFETKGTPLLRRIRPYSRRQPTGKQRA